MLVLERKVFQFRLYGVETQTVGKRCVYIQRLTRNLVTLGFRLTVQMAHVVKTVAYLYEDYANVLTHGEQQLLEVLRLLQSLVTEDAACNLRESIYYEGYLLAEYILNIVYGVVSPVEYIVQQCGTDACTAQPHLLRYDGSNGYGVHHVGVARLTMLSLVGTHGKIVCLLDYVYFLPMI